MQNCVVCGAQRWSVLASADLLNQECAVRERFVRERLTRPASTDELKDLTDFFHQGRAEILVCSECSVLLRKELEERSAGTYSEDDYNFGVMEHQYPRYLEAFRAKERCYRGLLAERARVVELGSHYGAFLQTASEWGWIIEGIDVGKDTASFARSKGFTVHNCDLAECRFASSSRDAIFVWNCFEQIADPRPVLEECWRILRRGGMLVLRTPNGLFYSMAQELLRNPRKTGAVISVPRKEQRVPSPASGRASVPFALLKKPLPESGRAFLMDAMAYNNLLGFPYLYGHNAGTLNRLAGKYGFARHSSLNSELLTLPLPEHPDWVETEEHVINTEVLLLARSVLSNRNGLLAGPWIEITFKAQ